MNPVEIEQAVTELAAQPFDAAAFPYAFLEAFGNKPTTIKRLQAGNTNRSDLGGVLQTGNIHIKVVEEGSVTDALAALRQSPATARFRVKFVLATDGHTLEAEELASGETVACHYSDFPDHFGFFLALAGISTVAQIRESAFDIRATSRLNRLYVTLIKDNPDWAEEARRHDMNHFMARLIFCFFAEDTGIFQGEGTFTRTVAQMGSADGSNTHEVLATLFQAMNTPLDARADAGLPRWAAAFPYVNGGLFSGALETPRFSRLARSYLQHIGQLDWTLINPDIFGSMIQAVADEDERGQLGMHYTSVPNILKVLNPLFLDELRQKLAEAGGNPRALLNLRRRIARIRVFDPACGSGNFLVIAYRELRAIESEINRRRGEAGRASDIPLTNFRGIEIRDFAAEIARLALVIAEYQANERHLGQQQALQVFLPLSRENWITQGNALQLDWLALCPPTGTGTRLTADDLFQTPLDQSEIDFDNEGGETYICGNPPYLGSKWQSAEQKQDLERLFDRRVKSWKSLDYVAGWFLKAADYCTRAPARAAFVATNSICQGQQVPILWPEIFATGCEIEFAHTSFKWANLAAHNAGVTVAIVGISARPRSPRRLFQLAEDGQTTERECGNINAYLIAAPNVQVSAQATPISRLSTMLFGNMPRDGGNLLLTREEVDQLRREDPQALQYVRRFVGSDDLINGRRRYCLWILAHDADAAMESDFISDRLRLVAETRGKSSAESTRSFAKQPHRFVQIAGFADVSSIVVPRVSSEARAYLPCGYEPVSSIIGDSAFALYDAPLWNLALIASRLHLVWIATVCGKLETRYRYSNTLGWNTFPVPRLTRQNKADLTTCAENILLAREAHFPATIAELYAAGAMPDNLRAAHAANDETLERIYIGRRFRNDSERLEKLFELYTQMTTAPAGRVT